MSARHRKCPHPEKVRYATRAEAFQAVLHDVRLTRTYRCRDHWHTTSRPS